jgi:hypothetical protein
MSFIKSKLAKTGFTLFVSLAPEHKIRSANKPTAKSLQLTSRNIGKITMKSLQRTEKNIGKLTLKKLL